MEETTTRVAFLKIKPFCDSLIITPNRKNADDVIIRVKSLPNSVVQDLTEYILYPVIVHMPNVGYDVKKSLVDIVITVVSKITLENIELFNKFYISVLLTIYDAAQSNMLISKHEELKGSVVKCLQCLMLHAATSVIESFYTRENTPKISQGIYLCLSIMKTEKLFSLKVQAIEALITLTYTHDSVDHSDVVLKNQVANIVMLFLPGIVAGLQKIYFGSDILNHKVIMTAVKTLGRILALIMEDIPQEDEPPDFKKLLNTTKIFTSDPLGIELNKAGEKGMKKLIQTTVRNKEWIDAAAEKLRPSIKNLIDVTQHSHPKVRRELVEAIRLLIAKCPRSLQNSFGDLVEILIVLSEDDNPDVKDAATLALDDANSIITQYKMRSLVYILEESFYNLLIKLPRLIRRSDDATQLQYLNQLAGYLRILGKKRLPQLMASVSHLQKLILSLVYVIELDCSGVPILQENQLRTIADFADFSTPSWKKFKFIRDSMTEDKLINICKLLGTTGDLMMFVDTIFELKANLSHYHKEFILLLNWTLKCVHCPPISLVNDVIDNYIDKDNWYLPVESTDDEEIPLRCLQNNVVQSCLLTEGLGIFATALRNEYQQYLLKTLYLVIENAGSGNGQISHVGHQALEAIAKSQGHENITDLIRENVDYVSYHVTMKLKRIENNPGVLNVVAVVMKYSSMDMLPCLKEIVEDTLQQLSSHFLKSNVNSLLRVLYTFTTCLRQLLGIRELNKDNKIVENKNTIVEKVIQELTEYVEARKVTENFENDHLGGKPEDILKELEEGHIPQSDDNARDGDSSGEESKKPPEHVVMMENIMKSCLHFLPSREVSRSLLAMQTLQEGLYILSDWNEQLLPIVHLMWHPLVERFEESNILITNYAWQLLYTLALVSEDFIRSRTLKQVSPALLKFLDNAAKESYKKDTKHPYKYTQMFKLQKLLLTQLGKVARFIKLLEPDLWNLLTLTEPYLSCYQHPELQECCVNLYKTVAEVNGDIVWVKCLSVWHLHVTPISHDKVLDMNDLKIDEQVNNKSEYLKNVRDIFIYIDKVVDSIVR